MEDKYKYIIAWVLLLIIIWSVFFVISKKNKNTIDTNSKIEAQVDSTTLERRHNRLSNLNIDTRHGFSWTVNSTWSMNSSWNIVLNTNTTWYNEKNIESNNSLDKNNNLKENTFTATVENKNSINPYISNPAVKSLYDNLSKAYESWDLTKIAEIKVSIKNEIKKERKKEIDSKTIANRDATIKAILNTH